MPCHTLLDHHHLITWICIHKVRHLTFLLILRQIISFVQKICVTVKIIYTINLLPIFLKFSLRLGGSNPYFFIFIYFFCVETLCQNQRNYKSQLFPCTLLFFILGKKILWLKFKTHVYIDDCVFSNH